MSIKQSMIMILLLTSVSFSASALVRVESINEGLCPSVCGWSSGDIVSSVSSCVGETIPASCSNSRDSHVISRIQAPSPTNVLIYFWSAGNGKKYSLNFRGYVNASCPEGEEVDPDTGKCEVPPPPPCEDVKGSNVDVGWHSSVYGGTAGAYWCSSKGGGCASQLVAGSSYCGTASGNNYDCIATYEVTGPQCQISDEADDNWCNDAQCTDMVPEPNPDNPDPDNPVDPEVPTHQPSDPTTPIDNPSPLPPSDSTVTETDPEPVDPQPDVTEPELTPDSNGDIVKSVANLNKDVNKALTDLNIDINKTQADINNELALLNANTRQNSEQIVELRKENIDIYRNNKALIQGLNRDVTSAVRANTERIDAELERVGDKLDDINEGLDSITDVDTSGAGSGTCIDSDSCTGFYESSYPDGLKGILTEQMQTLKTQVLDGFLSLFGTLDLSNAQRPSFTIPVMDFGDFDFGDYVNLDAIFAFVRFVMIFSAIMVSRQIIFGG